MNHLLKIVKESGFFLGGSLLGIVLNYALAVVATRYLSPGDYGLFLLAFSVMNMSMFAVVLGARALERYIPYYEALGAAGKVRTLISGTLTAVVALAAVLAVVMHAVSGQVAGLFHKEALAPVLAVVALAFPFQALLKNICAVFTGLKEIRYSSLLEQVVLPGSRLALAALLLPLGYGLSGFAWGCPAAFGLSAGAAWWLLRVKAAPRLRAAPRAPVPWREVAAYSAPLGLGVALLAVQGELDTLFLGLFRSAEEVGAYRIYALFDRTFALVALSLAAIYKPVVAGLAATGRIEEIGELYQRVARWLFAINTLGLLVMFLLGQAIIGHLFTSRYLICYPALLIMLSGRFLNGSFGLEGVSLEALGHTRLLLLNMVILVSAKSALNYLLVPGLGMMGAALASALALVAAGLAGLIELYVLYGLQPYGLRHLKYAGSGLVLGLAAHGALRGLPPPGPGQTLAWVAALGAGYILSAYASGSLDAQDRLVLSRIKTKLWKAHPAA